MHPLLLSQTAAFPAKHELLRGRDFQLASIKNDVRMCRGAGSGDLRVGFFRNGSLQNYHRNS
jgi:hypothetical protein